MFVSWLGEDGDIGVTCDTCTASVKCSKFAQIKSFMDTHAECEGE